MSINLSFDIGHSSIGWAALGTSQKMPEILGCGAVVFPPEDCQNHQRAGFRRQRRHIAATRNRVKRLEAFLVQAGAMTDAEIEQCRNKPYPWPWLLAAQVIATDRILSWPEMWSVLRWYAHNRGYDGNALWAGEDSDPDDVKKVQAARELMNRFGTKTMCETICAVLGVDPKEKSNPCLEYYFKGENAAFPRSVVLSEVRTLLEALTGKLQCLSVEMIEALISDWKLAKHAGFDARLPDRYCGGLLFGQLKPRFENRIIPKCRITGEKTPSKHSREFYRFRWAMLLSNLRVGDVVIGGSRPLLKEERLALNSIMEATGYFTKATLKKAFEKSLKLHPVNLDAMFLIPEMEQALTLDPARREVTTNKIIKPVWKTVPAIWKNIFSNQLFHGRNYQGKPPSFSQWRDRIKEKGDSIEEFDDSVASAYKVECQNLSKKGLEVSFEEFCGRPIRVSKRHMASGRAPYSRGKLTEAVHCVFNGDDPKAEGGPLEETEAVRCAQWNLEIDENTNNHLVRHRLKVFVRVLEDLVKRYADNDPRNVSSVCVEVVRDLVEFSGKSAKEKARILGQQLWHHRKISKFLEEEKAKNEGNWEISAGLIKKARIADDLNWICPYTGKQYSLNQIIHGDVDLEHIIPRSKRPTDALHALVLTFSHINREKGARTGLQYIEDTKDSPHTLTPEQYRKFVGRLKKNGPSKDDELRCTKRKIALLTQDYEPRGKAKEKSDSESVSGFTEGSLTQTSYLNKLAAQQVQRWFSDQLDEDVKLPPVVQLSGSVTAAVRRSWDLFDPLQQVCPETRGKSKSDIRGMTHLHHALDAVTVGLAAHLFPKDGHLWALMSKRKITRPSDRDYMRSRLGELVSFSNDGKWRLEALPESLLFEVAGKLAEQRVVRHMPGTMRGLKVQQNVWRILGEDSRDESKMVIRMRPRGEDGKKTIKQKTEKKSKLLGALPKNASSKLKDLKGALIVEENYGVALDPEPVVMPYRQVWKQLVELRKQNGGQPVRVIRNGNVISVKKGRYAGKWRVHSIKDASMGLVLDMAAPDLVKAENQSHRSKMNVLLKTLLKNGLVVMQSDSALFSL